MPFTPYQFFRQGKVALLPEKLFIYVNYRVKSAQSLSVSHEAYFQRTEGHFVQNDQLRYIEKM